LYGKTLDKASGDIRDYLAEQNLFFHKNLVPYLLTKLIFYFIESTFTSTVNIKTLFSKIGQIAAFFGLPLNWHLDEWGRVTQGYTESST
jgi:hypothetical protein